MVIKTILKKASYKNKRSMWYDTEFLIVSTVKDTVQRSLYENLGVETSASVLSSNDLTTTELYAVFIWPKRVCPSKAMRYGSLVWDVMAIKEDITFNSQKLQFDGHVNYGEEIGITKHADQLADHALLFVFRRVTLPLLRLNDKLDLMINMT